MDHNVILPDIVGEIYEASAEKIRRSACHVNRASTLGDDCVRRLVYDRTAWEHKILHDVNLQRIFDEGNLHEKALLRELSEAGVEVIQQQSDLRLEAQNITGHVDGVIAIDGKAVPVEIKSMSEHVWNAIAYDGPRVYAWPEVRDRFRLKPWTRRYPAQLQIYMLAKNTDQAVMLLKNKSNGAVAQINMNLDYDYAESLLCRAEKINAHVSAGTLPDRIEYALDVCDVCPYFALCLPDHQAGPPIKFLSNDEIQRQCEAREANEEAYREYQRADKVVKEWAKAQDVDRIAINGYLIERSKNARGTTVEITKL